MNRLLKRIGSVLLAAVVPLGAAMAQGRVGVTGAVNPQSSFERSSGVKTIVIGDNVLFQDRIVTGEIGLVQVLFVDGSTFTVGPTARVVIDEFVYNPSDSSGSLVAEVTSGALRFVGGKLSKRGNTVRFRTPGGTLGVRGGIVNIDLEPGCLPDGRCPTQTASFVFGDELLLDLPGGGSRRIHAPGYSFVFFGGGQVEIVPTSTVDQSSLQARLTGRRGATGGSNNAPTDLIVAQSGVPAINSARAPITVLPRPRPVITSRYSPEPFVPGITQATNVIADTVTESAQSDFVRTDVAEQVDPGPGPEPEPEPEPSANGIAAYATPEVYITPTGVRIEDPSETGIVDGVDITPYNPRFVERNGETELVVGEDRLPFPDTLGETAIAPFDSKTLIGVRARGNVVRGPDDFALYYLQEADTTDPDRVLYLVTGEPTKRGAVLSANPNAPVTVRSYELSDDFQNRSRGIRSELRLLNPLIAREFGTALAEAAETPFLIATRRGSSDTAQTFYGGLVIDGKGAAQRSAVNVDTGYLTGDGSGVALVGHRRGSYRVAADMASAAMTGSTGSLLNTSGKGFSSLYGDNGQSFVYTSGVEIAAPSEENKLFFDRQRSDGVLERPDEFYSSTTTVGRLTGNTPGSELSRQSRTLTGYAAGMVESTAFVVRPFRSEDVGDFTVSFDARNSTLGGIIRVNDIDDADPVVRSFQLAFGTDIFGGKSSSTRGTYIDDDTYAAVATGPDNRPGSPQTTLTTDEGQVIRHSATTPATYMIASDAVPQPQLFKDAGVTECKCEFLEWGWWGTATDFKDDSLDKGRSDFVHLGTWVAGDVTRAVDLPTTGTGSYEGHAMGTVVSQTADGSRNRYVAVGDLGVNYNFGSRTGQVSITNFDGRNFSGNVAGGVARDGVSNQFGGQLTGSGLTGNTRGAFVRGPGGPAQGVLGTFDVRGNVGRYRAVGNYVGQGQVR